MEIVYEQFDRYVVDQLRTMRTCSSFISSTFILYIYVVLFFLCVWFNGGRGIPGPEAGRLYMWRVPGGREGPRTKVQALYLRRFSPSDEGFGTSGTAHQGMRVRARVRQGLRPGI